MRKMLLFILFISALSMAQVWRTTVTTGINGQNIDQMETFTNKDGIHVLLHYNNYAYLNYFLLSPTGSVIRATTIESSGNYPKIVGDNNKVFALYITGSYIRVKKTTDAGQNWTSVSSDYNMGSIDFCGMDAAYNLNDGIHIVYSDKTLKKTYYYLMNENSNYQPANYKDVTDTQNDQGGNPSIALSTGRIHVSYHLDPNMGQKLGLVKTRDKYQGVWETPQQVVYSQSEEMSTYEKLYVRNNDLYLFYTSQYGYDLISYINRYKTRPLNQNTWSSQLLCATPVWDNIMPSLRNSVTTNNIIHSAYVSLNGLSYKNYDGSAWSAETVLDADVSGWVGYNLTSAANDVFVLWKNPNTNCLKMKQYDTAPLKVQNPQVAGNSGNDYVRLSWDKNSEPDIALYEVSRKVAENGNVWQVMGTTTNNYYIDNEYLYANPYGDFTVTYKVRAKDLNNQYSEYSDEITSRDEGNGKLEKKAKAKLSTLSTLNQNFPNPFNPSTEIEYTIRKSSQVKLAVYDILGNEVEVLVNEVKNPGNYRAQFNGNKLASGIYIYKMLTAEEQIVKKMLLTK